VESGGPEGSHAGEPANDNYRHCKTKHSSEQREDITVLIV